MHRDGHLGIGLLIYSPIAFVLMRVQLRSVLGLGIIAMAFWSFAPDIDERISIPHRGPTHSIVAAVVAGLLTAVACVYLAAIGVGGDVGLVIGTSIPPSLAAAGFGFVIGALGVVGHLLGDVVTPMGIRPWWPFSKRSYSLGLVPAANRRVNEGLSFVGVIAFVGALGAAQLL